ATHTIEREPTNATLTHFCFCVAAFYLGFFALGTSRSLSVFFVPVVIAFTWMIWVGFDQHYGGLEATRKSFYENPNWQMYTPEYIKRIQSNRIFATMVSPNAVAGAILLFGPVLGFWLVRWSVRWP